jgi:ElaB/YqjD/DUF883 family membrane-anchored ribosome-binding protein
MNTMNTDDFAKRGQDFADKAADKVQSGLRDAEAAASVAGEKLSRKVESARSQAAPSIKKAADQAQGIFKQGMDIAGTAKRQVRDTAMQASDSLVAFTKENPLKTIVIAAASGALLLALFSTLARSRD